MAVIAQAYHVTIDAWQTGSDAGGASYHVNMTRRNYAFWGGKEMCRVKLWSGWGEEYPYFWACPAKSSWKWNGSNYYLLQHGSWGDPQYLSWYYWAPQDGYITGDSLSFDRYVYIDRGASRQGSRTINIGTLNWSGNGWDSCTGNLTLTTSRIADVSNANLNVTCDSKESNPRYIRISASYTNPEGYYTGHISGPGINTDFTGSGSWTQAVTYDMYNTNRTYTLTIRGRDGTQYHSSSRTVYVEPGGVGIWRKENNQVKECFHVYYKNNQGNIIEVTEAWYKRNSQNIKTVK